MFRNTIAVLTAASLLAGCASQATRQAYEQAKSDCYTHGIQTECQKVVPLYQQAEAERQENGKEVATGILAGILLIGLAAAGAHGPGPNFHHGPGPGPGGHPPVPPPPPPPPHL